MGYLPIHNDEKVEKTSNPLRISTSTDSDGVSSLLSPAPAAYQPPSPMQTTRPLHPTLKRCIILAYLVLFILGICLDNPEAPIVIDLRKAPSCAFAAPIPAAHFHDRQQSLAKALHHLNASAFITEPGPTAQYYFNVSTTNWKLSERPFLFVLSPEVLNDGSDVAPKITVLAPKFEITRASLLDVPLSPDAQLSLTTWAEDASPYKVAHDSLGPLAQGNAVYVDGATRWFVVSGLQDAFGKNTTVSFPPAEISDLRSQKSQAEIQIMKCANEVSRCSCARIYSLKLLI